MADYNSVPPPDAQIDQATAIQDAMARAKQIAARLQNSAPGAIADSGETRKRNMEEGGLENGAPAAKRPVAAATVGDPKQVAMQVAQNIAQRAGLGSMVVEDIKIPNRFVGLIIGRGGEMINKLQSETSARIQVAPDPLPGQLDPERNITITGAPAAVETAKKLVNQICEDGKVPENLLAAPNQPGEFLIEHMIPSSKVGLIIGKGGETIRNLQERAGCRMVMIQDGQFQQAPEKPLRITGDPQKCQYGKQLVVDLLTEKDLEMEGRGQIKPAMDYKGRGGQNFGMDRRNCPTSEVPVPRDVVGFVIGKGGETIKRIQQESGCKVQFTMPDNGVGPDRVCLLQGEPQQIDDATQKIREIIDSSRSRGPPHSRGPPPNAPGVRSIEIPVPSHKCGIVIGKGGETIRQINQISGAHVEINKTTSDNPTVKHFIVRGTDSQIQHVQQLIGDKIGDQNGQFQGQAGGQSQPGMQQQWGGYGAYNAYGQQPQQAQYGQQPQQHFQQPQQQQAWQQYGQQYAQGAQPQPGAHQPGVPGQTAGQPGQGQGQDYTAAWAAYYQQYFQQYGTQPTASTAQAAATQAAPVAVNPAQAGAAPAASTASAVTQPGGAQPDYSAAWAAYYQQMYPGYQNATPGQQQPVQPGQGQPPRG